VCCERPPPRRCRHRDAVQSVTALQSSERVCVFVCASRGPHSSRKAGKAIRPLQRSRANAGAPQQTNERAGRRWDRPKQAARPTARPPVCRGSGGGGRHHRLAPPAAAAHKHIRRTRRRKARDPRARPARSGSTSFLCESLLARSRILGHPSSKTRTNTQARSELSQECAWNDGQTLGFRKFDEILRCTLPGHRVVADSGPDLRRVSWKKSTSNTLVSSGRIFARAIIRWARTMDTPPRKSARFSRDQLIARGSCEITRSLAGEARVLAPAPPATKQDESHFLSRHV
jgi:hypothetical protein